jgi:hypothetical protein
MQEIELGVVTAGSAVSLLVQGIKWLWRKFVAKNMSYEFPGWFYAISLPVLNIAILPVLYWLGFSVGSLPTTSWATWGFGLLQILIQSLISFFVYNTAIKPFNMYREALRLKREKKAKEAILIMKEVKAKKAIKAKK